MAGVEYGRPLATGWTGTAGLNWQRAQCLDEHGKPLTEARPDVTTAVPVKFTCQSGCLHPGIPTRYLQVSSIASALNTASFHQCCRTNNDSLGYATGCISEPHDVQQRHLGHHGPGPAARRVQRGGRRCGPGGLRGTGAPLLLKSAHQVNACIHNTQIKD